MSEPVQPRTHVRVGEAARRLGHSRAWVLLRIAEGALEGFKHSRRDVTVSLESILTYEARVRMAAESFVPVVDTPA